jgi:hypothetical protein
MRNSNKLIVITRRLLTPDKIPGINIAAWFSTMESGSVILDGTTASQWSDISGNNRHATQATKENQPTYTPDGLNGKPVLTFDGVNDRLVTASTTLGITNSASLIVVAQLSSRTPPEQGIAGSDSLTNRFGFFITGSNTMRWNPIAGTNTIEATSVTGAQILVGTAQSGNSALFRNGTSIATGTAATVTMANTPFNIGNMLPGTTIPHFSGPIAEVLVLPSFLSTTDRQHLEGYLAWKWELQANLANNHPFKFSPPYI